MPKEAGRRMCQNHGGSAAGGEPAVCSEPLELGRKIRVLRPRDRSRSEVCGPRAVPARSG